METSMDCNDQHVEYKNAKKVKMDKNGYNINNFIDTGAVAEDFLKTFYTAITSNNIQSLIDNNNIRNYTTIKYNNDKIQGSSIIGFLNNFNNYRVNLNKYNHIDSGSRRIDISVIGSLTNTNENINFSQTFIICNQNNSWYIKNSILMTF